MLKVEFPQVPLMIAFILGPMLESQMRQALLISRGDYSIFIHSPIAVGFLIFDILFLCFSSFTEKEKVNYKWD